MYTREQSEHIRARASRLTMFLWRCMFAHVCVRAAVARVRLCACEFLCVCVHRRAESHRACKRRYIITYAHMYAHSARTTPAHARAPVGKSGSCARVCSASSGGCDGGVWVRINNLHCCYSGGCSDGEWRVLCTVECLLYIHVYARYKY